MITLKSIEFVELIDASGPNSLFYETQGLLFEDLSYNIL